MKKIISALFCLSILIGSPAQALESVWSSTGEIQARILVSSDSIAPDQSLLNAAIHTRLAPGWHSYWRSPGESGLPPVIKWDASSNIESITMSFPAPKRFKEMDLTTFGYDGEVTFPLDIKLKEAGKAAKLDLSLDMMVCNEICIPVSLPLSLEVKAGAGQDTGHARIIEYARSKVPVSRETPQLKIESMAVTKDKIVTNIYSKRGFAQIDLIAEIGEFALGSDPQIQADISDSNRAIVVIDIPEGIQDELAGGSTSSDAPYAGQTIRVTLIDGRNAVEQAINF